VGNSTTGSIRATVRDSVMAGNAGMGVVVNEIARGTTTVMIDRSAMVNNGFEGIIADGGAVSRIGDSKVTGNVTGLGTAGAGQIISYQTNKIDGNGTDGTPTGTTAMK
jgi:hypothetical protein